MNPDTSSDAGLAAKKALSRQAAEKVSEILKWLHKTKGAPTKFEVAPTQWCYAKKGDVLPETNLTNPEVEQQALQDGFYFAATTPKAGSIEEVEHTWLGGLEADTFITHLGNQLARLPSNEIETVRISAEATRMFRRIWSKSRRAAWLWRLLEPSQTSLLGKPQPENCK